MKSYRSRVSAVAACLLLAAGGALAEPQQVIRGATPIGDPVVAHVWNGDLRDLAGVTGWKAGDAFEINPRRWTNNAPIDLSNPMQLDPLLERQNSFRGPVTPQTSVLFNFEGLDFGGSPPDPTGDIGERYFLQSVNASPVAIFDKTTGTQVGANFQMSSLAPIGDQCRNSGGDPIIVYDNLARRWVITEFPPFPTPRICVYVSQTSDPVAGGWFFYGFATGSFPDYPKYSVWPDAYYATTNQTGGTIFALDRENMLAGNVARPAQQMVAPALPGLGFQAFTPGDIDGNVPPPQDSPAYFMRHRDTELGNQGPVDPTNDRLEIWEMDVDWDTPANTTLTQQPDIVVSEFDSNLCPPLNFFSCIPQPGTGTRVDPLLEVIMFRLAYRNFGEYETMVAVLQTDIGDFPDHSGERWFEVRKSGNNDWALHQEGTYSPDAEHRFMGSTAMDGDGNIFMIYALSSTTTSPSVVHTGRLADDPAGVMSEPERTLVAGTGFSSTIRYGDYSQTNVDPVDDCTFWSTVQYAEGNGNTSTNITAVRFDDCVGGIFFADGFEFGGLDEWGP